VGSKKEKSYATEDLDLEGSEAVVAEAEALKLELALNSF
jgi:hypothetical protein